MAAVTNAIRNPTLSILAPGAYLTVWVQNVGAKVTAPSPWQSNTQMAIRMNRAKPKAPALQIDYVEAAVPYLLIRGCGICHRVTVH